MPCLHLSHMKCLLHDVEINNFIIDFCLSHIADESGCTINALSELSAAIATGMTPPVCKITNNTEKLIIPFHLAECKHWVLIVIDLANKVYAEYDSVTCELSRVRRKITEWCLHKLDINLTVYTLKFVLPKRLL